VRALTLEPAVAAGKKTAAQSRLKKTAQTQTHGAAACEGKKEMSRGLSWAFRARSEMQWISLFSQLP
jgi:hypothetical protein